MKTAGALFGMTHHTWKERQTNGSLFEMTELEKKFFFLTSKLREDI